MGVNPIPYAGTTNGVPPLVLPHITEGTKQNQDNLRAIQTYTQTAFPPNPAAGEFLGTTTNEQGKVVTEWTNAPGSSLQYATYQFDLVGLGSPTIIANTVGWQSTGFHLVGPNISSGGGYNPITESGGAITVGSSGEFLLAWGFAGLSLITFSSYPQNVLMSVQMADFSFETFIYLAQTIYLPSTTVTAAFGGVSLGGAATNIVDGGIDFANNGYSMAISNLDSSTVPPSGYTASLSPGVNGWMNVVELA